MKQAGKHGEGLEILHPHWPWAAKGSTTHRTSWVLQEVVSGRGALHWLSSWINIMEKFCLTAFLQDFSITLDISHLSRKGEGNSNPAPAVRVEQKPLMSLSPLMGKPQPLGLGLCQCYTKNELKDVRGDNSL